MIRKFQYILGLLIVIGFFLSLFPGVYDKLSAYIMIAIVIQMIISYIRLSFINFFIEAVILFLSLLSMISYIGIVFRLMALIISAFDMVGYHFEVMHRGLHYYSKGGSYQNFSSKLFMKRNRERVKSKQYYKDAKFTEKRNKKL